MAFRISPGSVSREGTSGSIGRDTGGGAAFKPHVIVVACCRLLLLARRFVIDTESLMTAESMLSAAKTFVELKAICLPV
jgi:hypothetical protein